MAPEEGALFIMQSAISLHCSRLEVQRPIRLRATTPSCVFIRHCSCQLSASVRAHMPSIHLHASISPSQCPHPDPCAGVSDHEDSHSHASGRRMYAQQRSRHAEGIGAGELFLPTFLPSRSLPISTYSRIVCLTRMMIYSLFMKIHRGKPGTWFWAW